MQDNPYESPQLMKVERAAQTGYGWSIKRWAFVLLMSPLAVAIWIAVCLGIGWTMMTLDWPPFSIRQYIGPEVFIFGVATIAAFPSLTFLIFMLRVSRHMAPNKGTHSEEAVTGRAD
jgi:hypothetical protein